VSLRQRLVALGDDDVAVRELGSAAARHVGARGHRCGDVLGGEQSRQLVVAHHHGRMGAGGEHRGRRL